MCLFSTLGSNNVSSHTYLLADRAYFLMIYKISDYCDLSFFMLTDQLVIIILEIELIIA